MRKKLLRAIACAIALSLSLAGCQQSVDLDAVRQLAASTTAASSSYASLAADYYQSCLRDQHWREFDISIIAERIRSSGGTQQGPATPPKALGSADIPINKKLPDAQRTAIGQIFDSKADLAAELDCDGNAQASTQWQIWNQILVSYIAALGNIAGGSKDDADFGVGQLANSLQKSKLLTNQGQVDALSKAANDAIGALFAARRRGEIAKFAAGPGNAFITTYIPVLQRVATDDYRKNMLFKEEQALDAFFNDNLLSTKVGIEALSALTYVSQWTTYRTALDQRKQAAVAYVKSLDEIKHAHDELVAAIANNKTNEVARIIQVHLNQFGPDITAINKAFK